MRIGIYAPNLAAPAPSGTERYATELVRALGATDNDHEWVLFTDSADLPAPRRGRRVTLPTLGRFGRLRLDHGRLARMARDEGLDVLHCTKSFVPAGLQCASVVTVHDVIFLRHPEFYPYWWRFYWTRALRKSVERATAVLCVSETTARDVEELIPAARGKTHAVPSGIRTETFAVTPSRAQETLRRLGLPAKYFLSVGNITARKNIPVLLDAFARNRAAVAAGLVIVGTPEDEPPRGEGVLHFAGLSDEDLAAVYSEAVALVYPSRYEGFGLPVLEAMSAGCPVIATTGGALPEIAGDAALLVEPNSAPALAGAMERLAQEPDLRRSLRERGRNRCRKYSWVLTAARTLELYERAGEAVRSR